MDEAISLIERDLKSSRAAYSDTLLALGIHRRANSKDLPAPQIEVTENKPLDDAQQFGVVPLAPASHASCGSINERQYVRKAPTFIHVRREDLTRRSVDGSMKIFAYHSSQPATAKTEPGDPQLTLRLEDHQRLRGQHDQSRSLPYVFAGKFGNLSPSKQISSLSLLASTNLMPASKVRSAESNTLQQHAKAKEHQTPSGRYPKPSSTQIRRRGTRSTPVDGFQTIVRSSANRPRPERRAGRSYGRPDIFVVLQDTTTTAKTVPRLQEAHQKAASPGQMLALQHRGEQNQIKMRVTELEPHHLSQSQASTPPAWSVSDDDSLPSPIELEEVQATEALHVGVTTPQEDRSSGVPLQRTVLLSPGTGTGTGRGIKSNSRRRSTASHPGTMTAPWIDNWSSAAGDRTPGSSTPADDKSQQLGPYRGSEWVPLMHLLPADLMDADLRVGSAVGHAAQMDTITNRIQSLGQAGPSSPAYKDKNDGNRYRQHRRDPAPLGQNQQQPQPHPRGMPRAWSATDLLRDKEDREVVIRALTRSSGAISQSAREHNHSDQVNFQSSHAHPEPMHTKVRQALGASWPASPADRAARNRGDIREQPLKCMSPQEVDDLVALGVVPLGPFTESRNKARPAKLVSFQSRWGAIAKHTPRPPTAILPHSLLTPPSGARGPAGPVPTNVAPTSTRGFVTRMVSPVLSKPGHFLQSDRLPGVSVQPKQAADGDDTKNGAVGLTGSMPPQTGPGARGVVKAGSGRRQWGSTAPYTQAAVVPSPSSTKKKNFEKKALNEAPDIREIPVHNQPDVLQLRPSQEVMETGLHPSASEKSQTTDSVTDLPWANSEHQLSAAQAILEHQARNSSGTRIALPASRRRSKLGGHGGNRSGNEGNRRLVTPPQLPVSPPTSVPPPPPSLKRKPSRPLIPQMPPAAVSLEGQVEVSTISKAPPPPPKLKRTPSAPDLPIESLLFAGTELAGPPGPPRRRPTAPPAFRYQDDSMNSDIEMDRSTRHIQARPPMSSSPATLMTQLRRAERRQSRDQNGRSGDGGATDDDSTSTAPSDAPTEVSMAQIASPLQAWQQHDRPHSLDKTAAGTIETEDHASHGKVSIDQVDGRTHVGPNKDGTATSDTVTRHDEHVHKARPPSANTCSYDGVVQAGRDRPDEVVLRGPPGDRQDAQEAESAANARLAQANPQRPVRGGPRMSIRRLTPRTDAAILSREATSPEAQSYPRAWGEGAFAWGRLSGGAEGSRKASDHPRETNDAAGSPRAIMLHNMPSLHETDAVLVHPPATPSAAPRLVMRRRSSWSEASTSSIVGSTASVSDIAGLARTPADVWLNGGLDSDESSEEDP